MSVIPVVSISGPALSYLLYENTKSNYQQEGFLLGSITQKETKTITDNDQQQITISKTVHINSTIACPKQHYFYNGIGKVDRDKVLELLGDQWGKVVGWYKFEKVSSFRFTFRNKIVHQELMVLFESTPDLFTCGLLINECSDNKSTHMYSQAFVRYAGVLYERLPLHIPNLGDANNTYKTAEPTSDFITKIFNELKVDFRSTPVPILVNKIHNAVTKHIESVVADLSEAEKQRAELEQEVNELINKKKLGMLNDKIETPKKSPMNVNDLIDGESTSELENNSVPENSTPKRRAPRNVNKRKK